MSPRHTSTACHGCGLVTDRDVNAVHNILQRGSALAACEIGVSHRPGASENVVHFHVVGVSGQDQNGIRRGVSTSRHVYHFPSMVDGQGPSVADSPCTQGAHSRAHGGTSAISFGWRRRSQGTIPPIRRPTSRNPLHGVLERHKVSREKTCFREAFRSCFEGILSSTGRSPRQWTNR